MGKNIIAALVSFSSILFTVKLGKVVTFLAQINFFSQNLIQVTVDTCLHPWRRSDQSGVLQQPCTVPVYKLLCTCQETSAVVPIVAPSSTVVTQSGCTLCTVHCASVHTLTRRQLHALVALSPAFIGDIFVQLLLCALHWLQLTKCFSLSLSLRNQQTFFHTYSFCWKLAVATTALNF